MKINSDNDVPCLIIDCLEKGIDTVDRLFGFGTLNYWRQCSNGKESFVKFLNDEGFSIDGEKVSI